MNVHKLNTHRELLRQNELAKLRTDEDAQAIARLAEYEAAELRLAATAIVTRGELLTPLEGITGFRTQLALAACVDALVDAREVWRQAGLKDDDGSVVKTNRAIELLRQCGALGTEEA